MQTTLGRTASRLHLLLVLAVAVAGVGVLVMVGAVMVGGDAYSRDMALLAATIASPVWLLGLVAAVEVASILRGRRTTRRGAVAWALAILAGGLLLAVTGGQMGLVITLLTRPDLVGLDWPVIAVVTADGSGAQFHYADQLAFWLPTAAVVVGAASLVALVFDRHARPEGVANAAAAARR